MLEPVALAVWTGSTRGLNGMSSHDVKNLNEIANEDTNWRETRIKENTGNGDFGTNGRERSYF